MEVSAHSLALLVLLAVPEQAAQKFDYGSPGGVDRCLAPERDPAQRQSWSLIPTNALLWTLVGITWQPGALMSSVLKWYQRSQNPKVMSSPTSL